ncbi:molybdopterin-binding protein [Brytella acorum]|uniref:hypothetical protein n=1 Tax=Brytella acorum TaxID=2959299 RepID=UPI0025AE9C24|nr:hypothetical protein [Brytella acorum]MDF3625904.1 hypothetical protein [Brytella acorum]
MSQNRLDRSEIAPELRRIERRLMLKGALSLGGLSMLSGCALDDEPSVERALSAMSRFTDRMQALLFSRQRLAREFDASQITHPFPFNAYYGESEIRTVDPAGWRLEVGGLVSDKRAWSLAQFRALPQKTANYTSYLRRGMECDRGVVRRAAVDVPATGRRGSSCEICQFSLL